MSDKNFTTACYVLLGLVLAVWGIYHLFFSSSCVSPEPDPPAAEVAAEPEPPWEPPPEVRWDYAESPNLLDDSLTVLATLQSAEGVSGRRKEPVLFTARCDSGQTFAGFYYQDYLGSDDPDPFAPEVKDVGFRFPPSPAVYERWPVRSGMKSLVIPEPIPFLRAILHAATGDDRRLVLRVSPKDQPPIIAVFDLTSAASYLRGIADACDWPPLPPEEPS